MLRDFLLSNRCELTRRCGDMAIARCASSGAPGGPDPAMELLFEQLAGMLCAGRPPRAGEAAPPDTAASAAGIRRAAASRGAALYREGCSIGEVVHRYGDACLAVTVLAFEQDARIPPAEFQVLRGCLDDAVAGAASAFLRAREQSLSGAAENLQRCLREFSQEQRRMLDIVSQADAVLRTGRVGPTGATGTLLVFALGELRALSERALPEIHSAASAVAASLHP